MLTTYRLPEERTYGKWYKRPTRSGIGDMTCINLPTPAAETPESLIAIRNPNMGLHNKEGFLFDRMRSSVGSSAARKHDTQ